MIPATMSTGRRRGVSVPMPRAHKDFCVNVLPIRCKKFLSEASICIEGRHARVFFVALQVFNTANCLQIKCS